MRRRRKKVAKVNMRRSNVPSDLTMEEPKLRSRYYNTETDKKDSLKILLLHSLVERKRKKDEVRGIP